VGSDGSGAFSVAAQVDFCAARVAGGGVLLGVLDDERPAGLAIVDPSFEPPNLVCTLPAQVANVG
jgi:hypothetical protein